MLIVEAFLEVKMKSLSKKQIAGFFIAGAAAGAVAALLYTPKTGAQARKDIRRFSKRTANQLGDLQQDVRGIWTSPDGAKIAWFKDPNGNILSLTEFPVA